MDTKPMELPKDGWEGLKQNWSGDMLSGFLVFMLALPLSLGIAKASEFPPVMGVLTAIIGGIIVSLFAGSRLTIKGPAAGLIVIVAGAVQEFGGGELGWKLALGTIAVAGVIQILFGVFKLGSLSDFFPSSVVHGMLAAIGLIIFSKQIHVVLGIDPKELKGMEPLELYAHIPHSIMNLNPHIALVGIFSLLIVFGLPMIKNQYTKMIPSPLLVLAVAIPVALVLDFKTTEPAYALVKIGNFIDNLAVNISFEGLSQSGTFIKYVIMFALVGTIESLLTVKAIDSMDSYKRKSNSNKDLIAVGIGNTIAGILGGLPMISEVARSSANVNNGAKTRWANFFHGAFLLISMLVLVPVLEMIPNAALAAMLIGVGYRLASPREFYKTYKIGAEQLVIFVVTIIATLATDLLIGVGVGILVKFFIHAYSGVSPGKFFKTDIELDKKSDNEYIIRVNNAAIFSNYLGMKKYLETVPKEAILYLDLSKAVLVDHTFMEHLHLLEDGFNSAGGELKVIGLEKHVAKSNHPLAAKVRMKEGFVHVAAEVILNPRQRLLKKYAEAHSYQFEPRMVLKPAKFKAFGFGGLHKIKAEENVLKGIIEGNAFEVFDINIEEVQRLTKYEYKMTALMISESTFDIPDFSVEAEGLLDLIIKKQQFNFVEYPEFSKRYLLTGADEESLRAFFTKDVVDLFMNNEGVYIDVVNGKLFIYKEPSLLSVDEINKIISFAQQFITLVNANTLA